MDNILYIDDEKTNLDVFKVTFTDRYSILLAQDTLQAYELLTKYNVAVVITDQRMPCESGIDFIHRVKEEFPNVIFMILSAYSDFDVTLKAIKSGRVYRFIQKPWVEKELAIDINNALEHYHVLKWNKQLLLNLEKHNAELKMLKAELEEENNYLRTEIKIIKNFENIITQDKKFLSILDKIEEIAESDASVLIHGETGTGKELIARAVHNLSKRKDKPFICVNCAAIPESLFETEMFGHEKGAFTGAFSTRKGKFELANNGTLFLDEIGEIPLVMQPKFLRAIEEGVIDRIGGNLPVKLNLRIICATNRILLHEIQIGNFRSDLFYRLNVCPIELPPLKERLEDIPLLVEFFIERYCRKYQKKKRIVPVKVINRLKSYHWPGNVRELENIIERAVIIAKNGNLNLDKFIPGNDKQPDDQTDILHEVERKHIINVLNKTSWRIGGEGGAAERLGMNRTTLQSRMKKLNINRVTQ